MSIVAKLPLLAGELGSLCAALSGGRVAGITLWVGFALLTIAFILLTRTRWGQARPMSKCIALSVFVHLLFLSYAYGTKLIFDYPAGSPEPVMRVKLLAAADERDQQSAAEELLQPWEGLQSPLPIAPQWQPPERHEAVDTLLPQRDHLAGSIGSTAELPATEIPDEPPSRPEAELPQLSSREAAAPAMEQAHIEPPVARQTAEAEVATPTAQPLARAEATPQPAIASERPLVSTLPSDLLQVDSQLQRLEQFTVVSSTADAAGAEQDRLREASNQALAEQDANAAEAEAAAGAAAAELAAAPDTKEPAITPLEPAEIARSLRDVRRVADGQFLPEPYRLRMQPERGRMMAALGGNRQTEAAVEAALAWLAIHQSSDGRWDPRLHEASQEVRIQGQDRPGTGADAETGITGLALLAFLGAGHSHLEGKYRKNVQYGLEYLLAMQKADGNLAGNAQLFASMYCHGMAALAISEAYALTGDERLRPYVERAVAYTVAAQHPTSGGWRYQPGDAGDMSQFGWQVMALRSAEMGGLAVPGSTHQGMHRFLRQASSGRYGGLASYRPGERATTTMTAEALTCRFFLEALDDAATVDEAASFIVGELPGTARQDLYYWYYGTLSLFHLQDERWRRWNDALQRELLATQRTEGDRAGSWDPDLVWGRYGGRVYNTALSALCLEVYYRYLPLQRD